MMQRLLLTFILVFGLCAAACEHDDQDHHHEGRTLSPPSHLRFKSEAKVSATPDKSVLKTMSKIILHWIKTFGCNAKGKENEVQVMYMSGWLVISSNEGFGDTALDAKLSTGLGLGELTNTAAGGLMDSTKQEPGYYPAAFTKGEAINDGDQNALSKYLTDNGYTYEPRVQTAAQMRDLIYNKLNTPNGMTVDPSKAVKTPSEYKVFLLSGTNGAPYDCGAADHRHAEQKLLKVVASAYKLCSQPDPAVPANVAFDPSTKLADTQIIIDGSKVAACTKCQTAYATFNAAINAKWPERGLTALFSSAGGTDTNGDAAIPTYTPTDNIFGVGGL